jgi:hypothetical protein
VCMCVVRVREMFKRDVERKPTSKVTYCWMRVVGSLRRETRVLPSACFAASLKKVANGFLLASPSTAFVAFLKFIAYSPYGPKFTAASRNSFPTPVGRTHKCIGIHLVRERERERESVCVCVCVIEKRDERDKVDNRERVCVCLSESSESSREREHERTRKRKGEKAKERRGETKRTLNERPRALQGEERTIESLVVFSDHLHGGEYRCHLSTGDPMLGSCAGSHRTSQRVHRE